MDLNRFPVYLQKSASELEADYQKTQIKIIKERKHFFTEIISKGVQESEIYEKISEFTQQLTDLDEQFNSLVIKLQQGGINANDSIPCWVSPQLRKEIRIQSSKLTGFTMLALRQGFNFFKHEEQFNSITSSVEEKEHNKPMMESYD